MYSFLEFKISSQRYHFLLSVLSKLYWPLHAHSVRMRILSIIT